MKRIDLVLLLLCLILFLGPVFADTSEPAELQLGIVPMGFDHMQRPMDAVADDKTFADRLILTPNSGGLYQFVLFDGSRYELIAPTEVTVSEGNLGCEPISGFPDCTPFYSFWSTNHGSGEIRVVCDGEPLTLPFSVELPDMGWYQSATATTDSYIAYPRCTSEGADQRFYYLSREPVTAIQVELCARDGEDLETTEVKTTQGSLIGIAIDVPDCQVGDQIDLQITADGETYDGTCVIQFPEEAAHAPAIQIYRTADKTDGPLEAFPMGTAPADRTFYVFSDSFGDHSELTEDPRYHKHGGFTIVKHSRDDLTYFQVELDHSLFHLPALYFTVDGTGFTVDMVRHPSQTELPDGTLGFLTEGGLNAHYAWEITEEEAIDPTWEVGIPGGSSKKLTVLSVAYLTYENGVLTNVTDRAFLEKPQIAGNTVTAPLPKIPRPCAYFIQMDVLWEHTAYRITSYLTVEVKTDVLVDRDAGSVTAIGDDLCAAVYHANGQMTGFTESFMAGTTLTGLKGSLVKVFRLKDWSPVQEVRTIDLTS